MPNPAASAPLSAPAPARHILRLLVALLAVIVATVITWAAARSYQRLLARDHLGVALGDQVNGFAEPLAVRHRLDLLHLRWYYDYSPRLDDAPPGTHKVAMVRGGEQNRTLLSEITRQATRHPGHAWLIFNEPDLLEQDAVSDAFLAARGEDRFQHYARLVHAYATTITDADPTAILVGPNLFNLNGQGMAWLTQLEASYRAEFAAPLPFTAIGLHLYAFDPTWQTLPQLNAAANQRFLEEILAYARARQKPVWITELGVMWIYHDMTCTPPPAATPSQPTPLPSCRGDRPAWPEVTRHVTSLLTLARQSGVQRTFVFSSHPAPDPWAAVPNATYLLDAAHRPTPLGDAFLTLP